MQVVFLHLIRGEFHIRSPSAEFHADVPYSDQQTARRVQPHCWVAVVRNDDSLAVVGFHCVRSFCLAFCHNCFLSIRDTDFWGKWINPAQRQNLSAWRLRSYKDEGNVSTALQSVFETAMLWGACGPNWRSHRRILFCHSRFPSASRPSPSQCCKPLIQGGLTFPPHRFRRRFWFLGRNGKSSGLPQGLPRS